MNTITINGMEYERVLHSFPIIEEFKYGKYNGVWYKPKEKEWFRTYDGVMIKNGQTIVWVVSTKNWGKGTYQSEYIKNNMLGESSLVFFYYEDNANSYILENKPPFNIKCEDGVVVTDPDTTIYSVCTKGQWEERTFKASVLDNRQRQVNGFKSPTWIHFSSLQKRTEYILHNKKLLSLNDVLDTDHARNGEYLAILKTRLIEKIKKNL